jgi:hypothetical protein
MTGGVRQKLSMSKVEYDRRIMTEAEYDKRSKTEAAYGNLKLNF